MIHLQLDELVAVVTIDRPERRNALDTEHCVALDEALVAALDASARAIVLTGAGPAFCAGADLAATHGEQFLGSLQALLARIVESRVPVIAAVGGPALGAGTQLAAASDLRVVGANARFGVPAVRLGIAVDQWTVTRLAHEMGRSTARSVLLTGAELDATAALQCGFAHRAGSLDDAREWAVAIAALAPLSVHAHKLALARADGSRNGDGEKADSVVVAAIERAWRSADAVEGREAFRARRPARFEGR